MNTHTLTYEDLELVYNLFKVSLSIETLYKKLVSLEKSNQKDTDEYRKHLDYLKIALSVEKDLYHNAHLDDDQCNRIINFIIESKSPNKITDDWDTIISGKYQDNALRRIVNTLIRKIMLSSSDNIKVSGNNEEEDRYFEDIQNTMHDSNVVRSYLLSDLLQAIVFFNEEELSNSDGELRNVLINTKYYLSYIYRDLEEDLVECDFSIFKMISNQTKLMSSTMGLSSDLVHEVKSEYLTKKVIKSMYKLLHIKEEDNSLYVLKSMLRALFLLMDDEQLCDVNDFYKKIREHKSYLGQSVIDACFLQAHEDKNKQISLKF